MLRSMASLTLLQAIGQKLASLTLKEDGTLEIQGLFGRPITIKPMAKNLVALCFESPECV